MNNEFWDEVFNAVPQATPVEVEYRVHYDEHGEIYLCTMQDHPTDTAYLVVSREEYDRYFDYRVVAGKLTKISRDIVYSRRLQPGIAGYAVVKNHAGLLIEPTETYEDIEYYEYRNS
jgi:hypothetical protein